ARSAAFSSKRFATFMGDHTSWQRLECAELAPAFASLALLFGAQLPKIFLGVQRVVGSAKCAGEFAQLRRKNFGAMTTRTPFHYIEVLLQWPEQRLAGARDAATDNYRFRIET